MAVLEMQATRLPFVVKAGEDHRGGPLHVVGSEISVKISSEDTGGAYTVFEGITPPLSGPLLHCHRSQDEWWYILHGRFRFLVGDETSWRDQATRFSRRGGCAIRSRTSGQRRGSR
jgi:oxalate decarboxylase/phosphoglucose isomerase-like protein (cupin superfamily)